MAIKCHLGITPSKECYEICVQSRRCEALKMWEREVKQMTKQEAIEILRDTPIDIRSTRKDDIHTLYATAQNMAIESLSRGLENVNADSCSEEPNRSDTINRQEAIEAIEDHMKAYTSEMDGYNMARRHMKELIGVLPPAQPEIIYCKDCVKHNKGHGYYYDGTVIGIKDCCPLVEIRGRAQGHEFDYQFCAYAERRTDG